jgi:hypothetical protein
MTPWISGREPQEERPSPPEEKRPSPPRLMLPVLALTVAVFVFSLEAGFFSMNRSQKIGYSVSIGMFLAASWTVKNVIKTKPSARPRVITFAVIAAIQIIAAAIGFKLGKDGAYPPEQRALMQELDGYVIQAKTLKEQMAQIREPFTEPEEILSLEPMVTSWKDHLENISKLDKTIKHDQLPPIVAEVLKVLNEGLAFDKRELENISAQISVVKSAKGLSKQKRTALYEQRLLPLMDQEEEINRQRKAANFDQRLKDMPKKYGYPK